MAEVELSHARYDAITLDARLRYYAALALTRALTEAEDDDRLHLLRCRVLRRLLPVRIATGPAIGHGRDQRLAKPLGIGTERGFEAAHVARGVADQPRHLLGRDGADIDLGCQQPGDDGERELAGGFVFVSHAGLSAPARAIGQ